MNDNLFQKLDDLRSLNMDLRQKLERAELIIPLVNEQLAQLAQLGLGEALVVEGEVISEQPYIPGTGRTDSGQYYQAAIVLPKGIGIALWDSEEFAALQNLAEADGREAISRFVPFADCPSSVKAALLPHVRPLLENLMVLATRATGHRLPAVARDVGASLS